VFYFFKEHRKHRHTHRYTH